jgi:hypothetical protein
MFNKLVSTFNNLKNLDYAVLGISPTATNEEVRMAYERKKYLIANGLILDPYGNEIKDIDTFINKSQPLMMDSAGRPIPGTGGARETLRGRSQNIGNGCGSIHR